MQELIGSSLTLTLVCRQSISPGPTWQLLSRVYICGQTSSSTPLAALSACLWAPPTLSPTLPCRELHWQLPAGVASLLGIDAAHVNVTSVQSDAGQPSDTVSAQSLLGHPGLRRLLTHQDGAQQHGSTLVTPTQHQALVLDRISSGAGLPGPNKHAAQPATTTSAPQHVVRRQHHVRMLQGSSSANISAALAIAPGTQSNLTSISHILTLGQAALLLQVAQPG